MVAEGALMVGVGLIAAASFFVGALGTIALVHHLFPPQWSPCQPAPPTGAPDLDLAAFKASLATDGLTVPVASFDSEGRIRCPTV